MMLAAFLTGSPSGSRDMSVQLGLKHQALCPIQHPSLHLLLVEAEEPLGRDRVLLATLSLVTREDRVCYFCLLSAGKHHLLGLPCLLLAGGGGQHGLVFLINLYPAHEQHPGQEITFSLLPIFPMVTHLAALSTILPASTILPTPAILPNTTATANPTCL